MKAKVVVMESERGWGQKVWYEKNFDSMDKAWEFVEEYNKDLGKEKETPDWYSWANDPVPDK